MVITGVAPKTMGDRRGTGREDIEFADLYLSGIYSGQIPIHPGTILNDIVHGKMGSILQRTHECNQEMKEIMGQYRHPPQESSQNDKI